VTSQPRVIYINILSPPLAIPPPCFSSIAAAIATTRGRRDHHHYHPHTEHTACHHWTCQVTKTG